MRRMIFPVVVLYSAVSVLASCSGDAGIPGHLLNKDSLATRYFNTDTAWYLANIPFFECSDQEIEQVYYYRWKMYKAHIRRVGGASQYVITEFINHVAWDRDPYCTINAASMHHIYEGRWLKDPSYMDGYIHYLYEEGGNDRRYSESIADAAYARFLVNPDTAFLVNQLDSMKAIYERWQDHWDPAKNLYYIPAMPDATEYTIASIDASGGTDGFDDGEAFRPTINSYMFGNARAIARIADMIGDKATRDSYLQKAAGLRKNVEQSLWNDSMHHFVDRFKADNAFVHYWNFIRGRELAGMIPWYFELPSDEEKYAAAWEHVLDTNYLLGPYGFRTNEPGYEYYFKQFVYFQGQRGSQWNGPSWPYQSSQTLTGMANLLNDYRHSDVTPGDYLRLLRLYTRQHFLPNGKLNLVENYDPNLGGPIVYYYWSNHYNHSSYNNLVISGLCGIRPSAGDTLIVNPLLDSSIRYFCLDDLLYHGHRITVVYDADGTRYHRGKGLHVWVDGKQAKADEENGRFLIHIGSSVSVASPPRPVNQALNIRYAGYPQASASVNTQPDSLFQAIDGRIWYFPEITNRWTTRGSRTDSAWYALDFGKEVSLSSMVWYPVTDEHEFVTPDSAWAEYESGGNWIPVVPAKEHAPRPVPNTANTLSFNKVTSRKWRIRFLHTAGPLAVTEIECY